jgi:hypothetical protein
MAQFFGIEDIKELTKASQTTISWASGSNLRIGGQSYNVTSTLILNTATDIDTGSIASDTIYYIYAVVVGGVVSLKYSLSNTAPTGFNAFRKIGGFKTDGSSEVLAVPKQDNGSVGDIIQSMLSEEQFVAENGLGWVLADGRDVTGSKYATMMASNPTPVQSSNNVPDLRGRFLRGRNNGRSSGANPDGEFNLGQEQGNKTRNPGLTYADSYFYSIENQYPASAPTGITTTVPRNGTSGWHYGGNGTGPPARNRFRNLLSTQPVSGGQNETAPDNTTVNYFIKVDDITI